MSKIVTNTLGDAMTKIDKMYAFLKQSGRTSTAPVASARPASVVPTATVEVNDEEDPKFISVSQFYLNYTINGIN